MSGLFGRFKKRDRRQPEPVKASDATTTDVAATSPNLDPPEPPQATPVSDKSISCTVRGAPQRVATFCANRTLGDHNAIRFSLPHRYL